MKHQKPIPNLSDLVPMERFSAPECEVQAIGAVLLDGEGLAPTLCALLADSDYFDVDNRRVAETIRSLVDAKQPVDVGTVSRVMLTANPPAKHIDFTQYLKHACPSGSLPFHCQQVLDASAIRSMLHAMYSGMGADLDVGEMRDALLKAADIAKAKGSTLLSLSSIADEQIDALDERMKSGKRTAGIPSGWRDLDHWTGGSFSEDVTLVGARPSVGKTAFLLQWALHVAERGYRVLFVSLEMSRAALSQRILASVSGVQAKSMRCGEINYQQMADLVDRKGQFASLAFDIDDRAGIRIRDIHAMAKRIPPGYGMVFVDYLGLIRTDNPKLTREQQVSQISSQIKAAAKDTGIPWVVASQLKRLDATSNKGNPKPILQDLRESGSLEQDADVVILLHRDDYGGDPLPVSGLDAILAKHRNGQTATVHLRFHRDTQRIDDAEYQR